MPRAFIFHEVLQLMFLQFTGKNKLFLRLENFSYFILIGLFYMTNFKKKQKRTNGISHNFFIF